MAELEGDMDPKMEFSSTHRSFGNERHLFTISIPSSPFSVASTDSPSFERSILIA